MSPCSRSRCKRPGVLIAGSKMVLCLKHQEAKKERKYKNRPEWSELANRRFDSAAERRYCEYLLSLEKGGAIQNLKFQVTLPLYGANGVKVGSDRADAVYDDYLGHHVIDVKGMVTPIFRLKAKLYKAHYGDEIEIVYPDKKSGVTKKGGR